MSTLILSDQIALTLPLLDEHGQRNALLCLGVNYRKYCERAYILTSLDFQQPARCNFSAVANWEGILHIVIQRACGSGVICKKQQHELRDAASRAHNYEVTFM